ncbi:MAG: PocR ligand-binding domain-containing protein [Candidatus Faecousia sp.]|nr:PocR ligand-binding domain-containing protein [Candidatus Faecousia sp.]
MAKNEITLASLLDIPLWESVQDQLANLTGTAIITVDYKGTPITRHSGRTEFCSVIRENPVYRKRCFRCDALASLEAVRLGKPYIYLCHCGIVDVAVPVMVGDRHLGAVMFGEVRLSEPNTQVVRLVNEASALPSEGNVLEVLKKYEQLPTMSYSRVEEIAGLISAIVHYIIDRAVTARHEEQTLQWLLQSAGSNPSKAAPVAAETVPEVPVPKSSPLYPALSYLNANPDTSCSMNEMAELCHLSPSYFSRLFTREVGEGFTTYVNRKKISLAKQQLRSTTKSVHQIASDLGYLNVSHFINLFKQFEGVTPTVYRQYRYK